MACVLVVDDDPALLELFAGLLAGVGHHVLGARDGAEALDVLDCGGVDVLVTDLQMPVLDGLALLAQIRQRAIGLPTIVVSGSWTAAQRQQALELGAARVMSKPVDPQQLAAEIADVTSGK